ncbi:hypoxia up-regulated protein 1-like [Argonauta hians]
MTWQQLATAVLVLLVSTQVKFSDSIAVMSIDLGSQFMKIGIVKPGVPMEIVLNLESKRSTPAVLAFKDGRQFSDLAMSTRVKMPMNAYIYLMDIIGKQFEDPAVKLYQKRFPYYNLVKDEQRGTVIFKLDEETSYSVEELLAMLIEYCKHLTEKFAEQPVKDAVITVPAHFNQAERMAVQEAASIGGLTLLQLMSVNAAVALNYGVFRRKDFSNKSQYVIFYDMGASSTTASVVGYVLTQNKEEARGEINPQLTIHGVAFDNRLGGLEMTLRLRDYLAKEFNKKKLTSQDVFKNHRSMAKLFKEAERLKKVLSANSEHYAQVENLIDNQDMRLKVTRGLFEEINADLFKRVEDVVKRALELSEVTLEEIKDVVLMGGGSRIPIVQENLMKAVQRKELGKSINTDEAAALGAVYQAAHLSQGFRVKKFAVKETTVYPIIVEFQRQKANNAKTVKRTLFGRGNPYPVKKVMTFNKHTEDFSFGVSYGDLSFISEDHRKSFSTMLLKNISLTGVGDAFTKHDKAVEYKGVRVHFRMDDSGILHLDGAESVFEQSPDAANPNEESTWSKLGNTLSGFFRGNEDNEGMSVNDEAATAGEKVPSADKEAESSDKASGDSAKDQNKENKSQKEKPAADKKGEEEKPTEEGQKGEGKSSKTEETPKPSGDKNQTNTTQGSAKKEEAPKPKKPTILKEKLNLEIKNLDLTPIEEKSLKNSKDRLADLKKKDEEKQALEHSKNELESFVFDMKDKLTQSDYMECSTEEQREAISNECSKALDWLYEQDESTKTEEYVNQLTSLKAAAKDLMFRVKEMTGRPIILETLQTLLNHTEYFYKNLYNHTTGDDPVFTQTEVNTLGKLVNETYAWRKTMIAEQAKTPNHEKPKLLSEDVELKIRDLEREVNYLVYKAKSFKPKTKAKPPATPPEKTNSTNTTDKAETKKPQADSETEKSSTGSPDTADTQSKKQSDDKKPPHRNDGEL